jgi:hypothetical protein
MIQTGRNMVQIGGAMVAPVQNSTKDWREVLAYFITTQDVKESSRKLYTRTLKLFFE